MRIFLVFLIITSLHGFSGTVSLVDLTPGNTWKYEWKRDRQYYNMAPSGTYDGSRLVRLFVLESVAWNGDTVRISYAVRDSGIKLHNDFISVVNHSEHNDSCACDKNIIDSQFRATETKLRNEFSRNTEIGLDSGFLPFWRLNVSNRESCLTISEFGESWFVYDRSKIDSGLKRVACLESCGLYCYFESYECCPLQRTFTRESLSVRLIFFNGQVANPPVTDREVGLTVPAERQIAVLPNPVSSLLRIVRQKGFADGDRVELFDLSGRLLASKKYSGGIEIVVPVGRLPQGILFARVSIGGKILTRKFLKLN